MSFSSELFTFLPQCCDVNHYLIVGKECAEQGACYNDLRPLGDGYWFSIPYRFGWPLEILIELNLLLTLVSIALSALTVERLGFQRKHAAHFPALRLVSLLLASAIAHGIFLYPTLRNAITDTPASLFALIGTWLLLLAPEKGAMRGWILLLAGLALGLSAWMRVFFVMPILFIAAIWLLFCLFHTKRQRADWCLFSLLPMIVLQYGSSWNHTHRIEYLPPNPGLMEWHMNSIPTGYDTVLPGYTFSWAAPCEHYVSVHDALQARDLHSLICQLAGKLDFYLGSYSAMTYWNPENGEIIGHLDDNTPSVTMTNLHDEPINTRDQSDTRHFWKQNMTQDGEVFQTLTVSESYSYQISLKAWSKVDYQYLTLEVRDHDTHEAAYGGGLILSQTPQDFRLGQYLPMTGTKDIVLTSPYIAPDSDIGQQAAAKGWTVNQGDFYISDIKIEAIDLRLMRAWSLWIFLANSLAFAGCVWFIVRSLRHGNAQQSLVGLFWLSGCAIALALAPEQRYVISLMITAWILFPLALAVSFKPSSH